MPFPSREEIKRKAIARFHHERRETEGINPEESELSEGGYMERARSDLMSEGDKEVYRQQEGYLRGMAGEMNLHVETAEEHRGEGHQLRSARWEKRVFQEMAGEPHRIHKGDTRRQLGIFGGKIAKGSGVAFTSFVGGSGVVFGKTKVAGRKIGTGLSNLVLGTPEQRAERKEQAIYVEHARKAGRKRGIYMGAYTQGFRSGYRETVRPKSRFDSVYAIGAGLSAGSDYANSLLGDFGGFGSQPRRRTVHHRKSRKGKTITIHVK